MIKVFANVHVHWTGTDVCFSQLWCNFTSRCQWDTAHISEEHEAPQVQSPGGFCFDWLHAVTQF